jgi:Mn2+/Fe2+ NRAMP family transporter
MLADTDAGNIVTAAEAGSRFGYRLLPILILLIPVLIIVQDLAVRIGLFGKSGFGESVRERFGKSGGFVAAAALVAATLGSLVTELTGIAGVGELYGVSRWIVLPLASVTLILVVLTGAYRRVERVALVFGLFELSFFAVVWQSHPGGTAVLHDIADPQFGNPGFLYLGAGLIGATFNPWMIFYQASAIAEKLLTPHHYKAAFWDTVTGAILTQLLTAAILVAIAALNPEGGGGSLASIGEISSALTPLLGETMGRAIFGAGVVGAAMAAAIVSSLACAWGIGEIFGLKRSPGGFRESASRFSDNNLRQNKEPGGRFVGLPTKVCLEQPFRHRWYYVIGYSAWIVGSAVLVLFVHDLVWLSIGMQVLNALLLPVVITFLVILAATVLPQRTRLRGWHLWLTGFAVGIVSLAGIAGAIAGLF